VGPWSDGYALGAVLYELLTLTPPHGGDSLMALLFAKVKGEIEDPRERAQEREVPDDLALVALRALAVKPADRYPSSAAMAEDLGAWLEGAPKWRVMARPELGKEDENAAVVSGAPTGGSGGSIPSPVGGPRSVVAGETGEPNGKTDATKRVPPRGTDPKKGGEAAVVGGAPECVDWMEVHGNIEDLWQTGNGVLKATGPAGAEHVLLFKTRMEGDIRLSCTAWCEADHPAELSFQLGACEPAELIKTKKDGYCLQFGGDNPTCTKLARHSRDMVKIVGIAPEPGHKYRIVAEAFNGLVRLVADGREMIRWQDSRPLSGGHVGFYAYGPGACFSDIVIESRGKPVRVSALDTPDFLYDKGQFVQALELYQGLAVSHPTREEGHVARYKAGLCLGRLGRFTEARAAFTELLGDRQTLPWGVLGETQIVEWSGGPDPAGVPRFGAAGDAGGPATKTDATKRVPPCASDEEAGQAAGAGGAPSVPEGEPAAAEYLLAMVQKHNASGRRWTPVLDFAFERAIVGLGRSMWDKIYPVWFAAAIRMAGGAEPLAVRTAPGHFRNMVRSYIRWAAKDIMTAHPGADDLHPAFGARFKGEDASLGRAQILSWVRQARYEFAGAPLTPAACPFPASSLPPEDLSADELERRYPSLPHLAWWKRRDAHLFLSPPSSPPGAPLPPAAFASYAVIDLRTGAWESIKTMPDVIGDNLFKTTHFLLKRIPAGTFMMGDETGRGGPNELPVHAVTLTRDFHMGVFPVTQRQWYEVMGHWPAYFREGKISDGQIQTEDVAVAGGGSIPGPVGGPRSVVAGDTGGPNTKTDATERVPPGEEDAAGVSGVPERASEDDMRPVEQVSWYDAREFCRRLKTISGLEVGLPTEAQWEYACKAGTHMDFSFGNMEEAGEAAGAGSVRIPGPVGGPRSVVAGDAGDPNTKTDATERVPPVEEDAAGTAALQRARADDHMWHASNSGRQTRPVGLKQPNPWGLYDMHGNVWEWCEDWCDGGYYQRSPGTDPVGPASGDSRGLRGGNCRFPDPGGKWVGAFSCQARV
ncbi:MAG: SUMF1/EgtB/PvdO family nonheme iron enzyme, partial [Planctomycetota bacterium]